MERVREVIAVDMDGVLANLLDDLLVYYNTIWEDNLTERDISGWRVKNYVDLNATDYLENILKLPNFYRDLKPIEGSVKGLNKLSEYYDVVILTDPYVKESIEQKIDWLEEYFPSIDLSDIIFTSQKGLINADYIIDDNIDNIINFIKMNGLSEDRGFLFSHHFNSNIEYSNKVSGWDDIVERFANIRNHK